MKIYRFWDHAEKTVVIDGQHRTIRCYGGSNSDQDDARRQAQQRLQQVEHRLTGGTATGRYGYADRILREPMIEELQDEGRTVAVLTRNSYGAVILNAAETLFADIDISETRPRRIQLSGWTRLLSLIPRFGSRIEQARRQLQEMTEAPASDPLERIRSVVGQQAGIGLRVYRTAGGYRCLATSGPFDPVSVESTQLLTALDSDPLYVRLCNTQECFRARLTAKPWRINSPDLPLRLSATSSIDEDALATWTEQYETKGREFSVCQFVETVGNPGVHHAIEPVVKLHDAMCVGDKPLA